MNDVWVLNGGHDLDLPTDPDEVGLGLDLALLDRLDSDLHHGKPLHLFYVYKTYFILGFLITIS